VLLIVENKRGTRWFIFIPSLKNLQETASRDIRWGNIKTYKTTEVEY
jgi:hypothetical protein